MMYALPALLMVLLILTVPTAILIKALDTNGPHEPERWLGYMLIYVILGILFIVPIVASVIELISGGIEAGIFAKATFYANPSCEGDIMSGKSACESTGLPVIMVVIVPTILYFIDIWVASAVVRLRR